MKARQKVLTDKQWELIEPLLRPTLGTVRFWNVTIFTFRLTWSSWRGGISCNEIEKILEIADKRGVDASSWYAYAVVGINYTTIEPNSRIRVQRNRQDVHVYKHLDYIRDLRPTRLYVEDDGG